MKRKPSGLIQPSTSAFIQEARQLDNYSLFDLLHGYIYARWPYLYIGIGTGEHRLAPAFARIVGLIGKVYPHQRTSTRPEEKTTGEAFADTYHGKVVPLHLATQLVMVNEEIRLPELEKIIPYEHARDIILKNPGHIVALDCPCRASRANPCLPLDVCLIVGEPFAGFVAEHHPQRSRWITSQEAVEILKAEEARGHVHHAFFKDAMLGRFYAICNCCACCCGAMQAQQRGTPMLASSGYLSTVDPDQCTGCGECQTYCPFAALEINAGIAVVNEAKCMGCGVCVSHCPQDALALSRAPSKGEPLEIFALMEKASIEKGKPAGKTEPIPL